MASDRESTLEIIKRIRSIENDAIEFAMKYVRSTIPSCNVFDINLSLSPEYVACFWHHAHALSVEHETENAGSLVYHRFVFVCSQCNKRYHIIGVYEYRDE